MEVQTLDEAEVAVEGCLEEARDEGRVGGECARFPGREAAVCVDVQGGRGYDRRLRRHGDWVGGR